MDEKSRVYVKTDSQNRVIQIEGEYSLSNFSDLSECILIEEGAPCARLNHAQSHYLPKPIYTDEGVCQYKWTGTEIVERTAAEIQADINAIPAQAPTAEERLAALEAVMLEMIGG